MRKRLLTWLPCLLLPVAVIGVYYNTLDHGFVYDDAWNIVRNLNVHLRTLDQDSLLRAAMGDYRSRMRPLSNLGFALSHYFGGGLNPRAFRWVNILLHALNALLFYLLLGRTLKLSDEPAAADRPSRGWRPVFCALLALCWALQPVNTSAVTYIHQRMVSQASFFFLLAMLCYVAARSASTRKGRILGGIACALAALASLASKEIALLLPPCLALYEWCVFQKLSTVWLKQHARKLWAAALLLAVAGIAGLSVYGSTWLLGFRGRWMVPVLRIATQARLLLFYLAILVVPYPGFLNVDHSYPISESLLDPWITLPGLLVPIALIALTLEALRRRKPVLLLGMAWFLLHMGLEAPLFALDMIAEYRLYLASFGASLMLAWLFEKRARNWAPVIAVLLGITALVYGTWTIERNKDWESGLTLWKDAAAKAPEAFRPSYNYGVALLEAGRNEEAADVLENALKYGTPWFVFSSLAQCYERLGRHEDAEDALLFARRIGPHTIPGRLRMARAMLAVGQLERARRAIEADSSELTSRIMLGRIALAGKDFGMARHWLETSRSARPTEPSVHILIAQLAAAEQKWDEALEAMARAEQLQAQPFEFHLQVARILLESGRIGDAVRLLGGMVEARPEMGEAHYLLGRAHELAGDHAAAGRSFERAATSGVMGHELWTFRGRDASRRRDFPTAIDCFRKSLRLEVRVPAQLGLAGALIGNGQGGEAEILLRKLLEQHPDLTRAHSVLGAYYVQKERYVEAILQFEAAQRQTPGDTRLEEALRICRERLQQQP